MDEHEAEPERSEEEFAEDSAPNSNDKVAPLADAAGEAGNTHEGKPGDALAWLEGPAFDSPIEEMPTLQWPDVEAEAQAAEPGSGHAPDASGAENDAQSEGDGDDQELEDAMQWLEDLAREQGTPLDEMPTLISGGEREQSAATEDVPELGATTQPPQLDSDPMAWLEQLAIDQNSPLEELPSVADRLLASEIASQTAFANEEPPRPLDSQPLELEAALRYLEEEAAAQGISLHDVSYDEQEFAASLDEDLAAVDRMAALEEQAKEGDEQREPADELAWLDDVDDVQTVPAGSRASAEEAPVAAQAAAPAEEESGSLLAKAGAAAAVAKLAGTMLSDEDEDQASPEEGESAGTIEDESPGGERPATAAEAVPGVALAEAHEEEVVAGQDASPQEPGPAMEQETPVPSDEATSVAPAALQAGAEDAPAAPVHEAPDQETQRSALAKAAAIAAAKKVMDRAGHDEEAAASAEEDVIGETASAEAAAAEVAPAAADADILAGMPEDPDEAMAWMGALAGEEGASAEAQFAEADEASVEGQGEPVLDEDALDGMPDDPDEAMRWMAALAAKEATKKLRHEEPPPGDAAVEERAAGDLPQEAPGEAHPEARDEQGTAPVAGLDEAKDALQAGDVAAAVTHYRALLDSGAERGELIAALKTAVEQSPDEPALQELLGDAYMQEGQTQQALRMYRAGLTNR